MSSAHQMQRSQVGDVRPSQALTTFGIGSLVDLPNFTVAVMGLDDWQVDRADEVSEERLLQSAQSILGGQVTRLMTPPRSPEVVGKQNNWFDPALQIGIPVAPFPRWMVCTSCRLLAPLSSGLFEAKVFPYRPDKASYLHDCNTKGKPPLVIPARFLVTCERGHLDDFPWFEFTHRGKSDCKGSLYLREFGPSGEMADVTVICKGCDAKRRLVEVIGPQGAKNMPPCTARRPHLRDHDPAGCDCTAASPIALGASNLWFPVLISALSVPQAGDELGRLVEENWGVLEKATSLEVLESFRAIGVLKDLSAYKSDEIWRRLEEKRAGKDNEEEGPEDLKRPEWRVFTNPDAAVSGRNFKLRSVDPPAEFARYFTRVVLVEKLREVRALIGFSRLNSPRDFDNPADMPGDRRAPLSRRPPTWLPASETRGEGVFLQFREEAVQQWVTRNRGFDRDFKRCHDQWWASKNMTPPADSYPGIRFVLLHSFAHALIRQLSVECGYTSASVAERIYSKNPGDEEPMAGVLIYTAASDSEGTLGGLCSLGEPEKLGRHLTRALEKVRLCSSDPLCSEHERGGGDTLHGAACHACSFLPETSCERGNKYLDRAALVATLERSDTAFFS
ncbi:hypothetical protein Pla175_17770 [Pirellulimonas nuda]|uniref:MrfA-like Zn-binding domain-containing protein n=1 Tax=Pirellulimonas nuda TaxID=2528009 RepID=A0A518DA92_9BACT|nr:DUF1998 domain-containing protein [Pirellulimonas nuda]QDU88401.1 hypothetical protein Pla175_17770 [Pirellulimonas nuda]